MITAIAQFQAIDETDIGAGGRIEEVAGEGRREEERREREDDEVEDAPNLRCPVTSGRPAPIVRALIGPASVAGWGDLFTPP